mgnify:CR=1 FL=1
MAARVKTKNMKTFAQYQPKRQEDHEILANTSKGEDAEHDNLANGSPHEDEVHENSCEWQQE